MVEACRNAGVPLMVHENFRFQSPLLEVRRILQAGTLGELTWGRINWRTGYDIYAGQPYLAAEERFILLDIGVHVLDLARVLWGRPSGSTARRRASGLASRARTWQRSC